MDFIVQLPVTHGYNAVLVVVDRFTKYAVFIPCTTRTTGEETAHLYIDRVLSHFGIPESIISDRGTQFTSSFWNTFWPAIGCTPTLSTAYHPQTDGQTERVNSVLEQYIRTFCSFRQDDWDLLLPLSQFAFNNTVSTAT